MAPKFDIVAAGHICLDITPAFPSAAHVELGHVFQPGRLLKIGKAVLSTGGSVSNTGIALSKLGCQVAYMTGTGADAFGDIIIEKMKAYGSTDGIFRHSTADSSYSIILALPGIDRIILHNPGCNDEFRAEQIDWSLVESARHFHLGYPPIMRSLYLNDGDEAAKILAHVKKLGISSSLDMALPDPTSEAGQIDWQRWLTTVLPHVDFFMPSIEEMLYFYDRKRWQALRESGQNFISVVPGSLYGELAGAALALGCAAVLLKAGHLGLYLRTGKQRRLSLVQLAGVRGEPGWQDRELWGASYFIEEVVSATGAGDSAIAGFLAALLYGNRPEECLQIANCLGYQNLRALDTISGIDSYPETLAMLPKLQPNALDFLDSGWQPTRTTGIWEHWRKPGSPATA